ncbi:MAG: hypothetical protein MI861_23675 [Pirellulales bacterium]|nr:hypothetical protein [Pirellulales bacterium]
MSVANQLALFETEGQDDSTVAEPPSADPKTASKKPRRGGSGRRRLDPNARRQKLLHRLRADQKQCPKCGCALVIVLVEGSLRWDYQPAEIFGICDRVAPQSLARRAPTVPPGNQSQNAAGRRRRLMAPGQPDLVSTPRKTPDAHHGTRTKHKIRKTLSH